MCKNVAKCEINIYTLQYYYHLQKHYCLFWYGIYKSVPDNGALSIFVEGQWLVWRVFKPESKHNYLLIYSRTRKHWKDISRYIFVRQAILIKKYEEDIKTKLSVKKMLRQKKKVTSSIFFTDIHWRENIRWRGILELVVNRNKSNRQSLEYKMMFCGQIT